jgi:hypothetical protein
MINYTDAEVECPVQEGSTVVLASDDVGEGQPYRGRLGPSQAVIVSRS